MHDIRVARQIIQLVNQANEILAAGGEGPRWTWFALNKSFIATVVGVILAVAGLVFPAALGFTPEALEAVIYAAGVLGSFGYAAYQRATGKTRAVWNEKQATDALDEALAKAIGDAYRAEEAPKQ